MNNIGGNAPLIVSPIREKLDLHKSLYIVYAGFYGCSSIFFFLAQLAFIRAKPVEKQNLLSKEQKATPGIEINDLKNQQIAAL